MSIYDKNRAREYAPKFCPGCRGEIADAVDWPGEIYAFLPLKGIPEHWHKGCYRESMANFRPNRRNRMGE